MEKEISSAKVNRLIKIAITGPESTGKSSLAQQLAQYYQTHWVPEYARTYIDQLNRPYVYEDLLKIAKGQIALEQTYTAKSQSLLFCDTELSVIKIWSEVKYGRCDPWILDQLSNNHYDLYLLLNIDLLWEFDPQREAPSLESRQHLLKIYQEELTLRQVNYILLSGVGQNRLQAAIKEVDRILSLSS